MRGYYKLLDTNSPELLKQRLEEDGLKGRYICHYNGRFMKVSRADTQRLTNRDCELIDAANPNR